MGIRRKQQASPLRLVRKKGACRHCDAEEACILGGLDPEITGEVMALIEETRPFQPGEMIYRRGDRFTSLFTLQNGCLKTEVETLEGRLQVTGFYLAGDLFGLDGIGSHERPSSAIALCECWCCRIPYQRLLDLCHNNQQLMERVLSRLGVRLQKSEGEWNLLMNEPVDHRVVYFLQYMLARQNQLGGRNTQTLELTMNKQDIANFLGITAESLSRSLGRLRDQRLIETSPHSIRLDPGAMERVSL